MISSLTTQACSLPLPFLSHPKPASSDIPSPHTQLYHCTAIIHTTLPLSPSPLPNPTLTPHPKSLPRSLSILLLHSTVTISYTTAHQSTTPPQPLPTLLPLTLTHHHPIWHTPITHHPTCISPPSPIISIPTPHLSWPFLHQHSTSIQLPTPNHIPTVPPELLPN